MKVIKLVSMITLLAIAWSCNDKKEYCILSGKIENCESEKLSLMNHIKDVPIEISLNEKGEYIDTIVNPGEFFYLIDEKRNTTPVYLENNSELKVSYDVKRFKETFKLEGRNIEKTQYYIKKEEVLQKHMSGNIYALSEGEMTALANKYKEKTEHLLSDIPKLSEKFVKLEKGNIEAFYFTLLVQYSWTKDSLSENFLSNLSSFDLNNEEVYRFSDAYKIYLYNYYNRLTNQLEEKDSSLRGKGIFKAIEDCRNEYIKNQLLFNHVSFNIPRHKNKEAFYNAYLEQATDKDLIAKLSKQYKELMSLEKGRPSPVFTNFENINGELVSLNDFKGKYVLIDFWATWCAPCVKETPYLMKLEEEFHGRNIQFIGISLNDQNDKETWKKYINKKGVTGVQLIADNGLQSAFAKAYQVNTIPRFVLIDTEGNIIDNDSPRPSNPKLKELLTELLSR